MFLRANLPEAVSENPTWDEMIYFLNQDHTNWNEYVDGDYTCRHFACDVCKAALQQELRCAFVHVNFRYFAHAAVAFETTDQGLIYFEPQADRRVKIEVGHEYWSWTVGLIVESTHLYWNDDLTFEIACIKQE